MPVASNAVNALKYRTSEQRARFRQKAY